MNTFPTSTKIMRNDLKQRLQKAVVEWIAAWGVPSGSVLGSFNLYNAVDDAVDAEFQKTRHAGLPETKTSTEG